MLHKCVLGGNAEVALAPFMDHLLGPFENELSLGGVICENKHLQLCFACIPLLISCPLPKRGEFPLSSGSNGYILA